MPAYRSRTSTSPGPGCTIGTSLTRATSRNDPPAADATRRRNVGGSGAGALGCIGAAAAGASEGCAVAAMCVDGARREGAATLLPVLLLLLLLLLLLRALGGARLSRRCVGRQPVRGMALPASMWIGFCCVEGLAGNSVREEWMARMGL
jgi:hypothetical protein